MQEGQIDRRYARVFETIATAWAESRKVRIAYSRQDPDGSTKVTRRVVSPRYLEPNPWGRGCYLIADGSAKPYRMKWRGASFSNLAILPHIIPGHKVADVVAIMGSVDPVFGEVDR